MSELLLVPFLACLVLAGIHAYLGLHVLARGVIFVDLALAQVAALGMTAALLAGHAPESDAAYAWALAFTMAGALVFALTRPEFEERPGSPGARRALGGLGGHVGAPHAGQEAIIGIVYAVAAALTVLVLDRVAQGGEQIKQLLVGSILGVTREDDQLPHRILTLQKRGEELPNIPPEAFRKMMDEYYDIRGWTSDGLPTGETLSSLGLSERKEVVFA